MQIGCLYQLKAYEQKILFEKHLLRFAFLEGIVQLSSFFLIYFQNRLNISPHPKMLIIVMLNYNARHSVVILQRFSADLIRLNQIQSNQLIRFDIS